MSRPSINTFVDLSQAANKRALYQAIAPLAGLYEITIEPRRNTRSTQQNRWYFGCIVKALRDYLHAQGQHYTLEECHRIIGAKFLRVSVCDADGVPIAGVETIRSTTKLTTAEFSAFCEDARNWLAEMFGIVVQDPFTQEVTA